MALFYKSWIKERFGREIEVKSDELVVRRRGLLGRLDTHSLVRDHRSRGEDTYHYYLSNFHPTWTDCTCEGYHAENFGMSVWQKPKEGDGVPFLASKNCTVVSHEIAHELLRQAGYKRYMQDVHDIWTKHLHAGQAFDRYDKKFAKTEGDAEFMTLDMSGFEV
ncbi:hypothetical protein CENSYa_0074 [Cenarchaeum symbiosum A]|uniref:Uncharacterized protein n=1 Tax=Cenarchaeum symbiosum (strain A) TaxID=414004 RepID=A0RTQ2_CENSY|nr:hypothetical protein CENSYa_0074 [Cenarchaeum symbiosum A]